MRGKKVMLRQSLLRRTTQVLFPILLLCGGLAQTGVGSAQSPLLLLSPEGVQGCAATTDEEIVAAVQARIKADSRFNDQWKHINVSSKNRIVTLSGWVRGSRQVRDLIRFARTTKCVRRVASTLWNHLKVGCGAGQKQCGETCIDRNQQCNLIQ
jgi:hypothetical protein